MRKIKMVTIVDYTKIEVKDGRRKPTLVHEFNSRTEPILDITMIGHYARYLGINAISSI